MMGELPRAAVIQDLSGFGRCSLTAAAPVLSAMGVQCCPLVTAVFSTHTGIPGAVYTDLTSQLSSTLDHWQELGLTFDAVCSGFLGSAEQAALVSRAARTLKGRKGLWLVDPVMGDHGSVYRTCTPEVCAGVTALAERADLITPNLTEAALLLGLEPSARPRDRGELERWAGLLSRDGARGVVITGVTQDDGVGAFWRMGRESGLALAARVPAQYPGTGDLFAAVLLGGLLRRESLADAVRRAVDFVAACVRSTWEAGTPAAHGVLLERELGRLTR